MISDTLVLDPKDNLAVALKDLPVGEKRDVLGQEVVLVEKISQKHKFALVDFATGDLATMYGVVVGKATQPIAKGALISTHNLTHETSQYQINAKEISWSPPDISKFESRTWKGYHRKDGQVGTANHWLVIPLVFCENRNINVLKETLLEQLGYAVQRDFRFDISTLIEAYQRGASADELTTSTVIQTADQIRQSRPFPNVDGIKFLNHDGGCGCTRQDSATLCSLLAGYITHPNCAGATILSLGCQNAQIADLKSAIEKRSPGFDRSVLYYEQQGDWTEREFLEEAVKGTFAGLMDANKYKREPAPLSALSLGLECGGSDGFSGLSANPALGYTSDLLVALGGKTLLAEFPELNGVEQELIHRCKDQSAAEKFSNLMESYNARAHADGSGFENNPSPGNIRDGLITDAIKSAGAAKKGGTSPVVEVLDYAEPANKPGLSLLCTPGGDVESTTGLAGSGANVIVFTTGLGTPTGNAVAPLLKMSTNTDLFNRMRDIIDINAGTIITGEDTIETKGEELLELIIKTASGEFTPAAVRLGQDDFIPWKRGISL